MADDLYSVLGVKKTASDEEIRAAYRKLAKENHPDLNPGDAAAETRFKEISGAFDILKDPKKRARYDKGEIDAHGAETPEQQYYRQYAESGAAHPYASSAGYDDFADFSDLFGDAFGGRGRASGRGGFQTMPVRGADLRYHLRITFMEAATGAKKRVTMPDGKTLDILVPPGIRDGQILRLKEEGEPGFNGGPSGDAYISITIEPHPRFSREDNDIVLDLPISLPEAVLGAKIEVPTLTGKVNLTIPKGAQSGQILRLRGKGIRTARSTGDQLVQLNVVLPETYDDAFATFVAEWAETHGYNPRDGREAD